MDESHRHTGEWKRPDRKEYKTCDSIFLYILRTGKNTISGDVSQKNDLC